MVIGIVCEYNPFHNGHIYQINKIKEKYPNCILIACLNGLYSERGEMGILSKEDKVHLAIDFGVDLVIELPILFGTQSADTFAEASIKLLYAIGIQKLIFGSETNDKDYLERLAKKQLETNFKISNSKTNYPSRLNEALEENEKIAPNDLLGICYIKSILKNNYPITYEPMKRTVSYYGKYQKNNITSASYIRQLYAQKKEISDFVPKESIQMYQNIQTEKIFPYLRYKILTDPNLSLYLDVTEGLDKKCKNVIQEVSNYQELLEKLTSKRYTYNRIRRMLIHIFLGIQKKDAQTPITYIHILGMNQKGKKYLNENRKNFLLSTKRDPKNPVAKYEKTATILYDIINGTNTELFESKNIPYRKTDSKESIQK